MITWRCVALYGAPFQSLMKLEFPTWCDLVNCQYDFGTKVLWTVSWLDSRYVFAAQMLRPWQCTGKIPSQYFLLISFCCFSVWIVYSEQRMVSWGWNMGREGCFARSPGNDWRFKASWGFMAFHGISWHFMAFHGIYCRTVLFFPTGTETLLELAGSVWNCLIDFAGIYMQTQYDLISDNQYICYSLHTKISKVSCGEKEWSCKMSQAQACPICFLPFLKQFSHHSKTDNSCLPVSTCLNVSQNVSPSSVCHSVSNLCVAICSQCCFLFPQQHWSCTVVLHSTKAVRRRRSVLVSWCPVGVGDGDVMVMVM